MARFVLEDTAASLRGEQLCLWNSGPRAVLPQLMEGKASCLLLCSALWVESKCHKPCTLDLLSPLLNSPWDVEQAEAQPRER